MFPTFIKAPEEFTCAVSGHIIEDAVTAEDGRDYDRKHIEEWFRISTKSPLMGVHVKHTTVNPCLRKQQEIRDWRKTNNVMTDHELMEMARSPGSEDKYKDRHYVCDFTAHKLEPVGLYTVWDTAVIFGNVGLLKYIRSKEADNNKIFNDMVYKNTVKLLDENELTDQSIPGLQYIINECKINPILDETQKQYCGANISTPITKNRYPKLIQFLFSIIPKEFINSHIDDLPRSILCFSVTHVDDVSTLIQRGADVNAWNGYVSVFLQARSVNVMEQLYQAKADIFACHKTLGHNAVHYMLQQLNVKALEWLHQHKVAFRDISTTLCSPCTTVGKASDSSYDNVLQFLAKYNYKFDADRVLIHVSQYPMAITIQSLLTTHKASASHVENNSTALIQIITSYHTRTHRASLVKLLLKHGVDVHWKSKNTNRTAMYHALDGLTSLTENSDEMKDACEAVELLLKAGAHVEPAMLYTGSYASMSCRLLLSLWSKDHEKNIRCQYVVDELKISNGHLLEEMKYMKREMNELHERVKRLKNEDSEAVCSSSSTSSTSSNRSFKTNLKQKGKRKHSS